MTLPTKLIAVLEVNMVAVCQLEFIPVLRVMTIKTPPLFRCMFELDIRVLLFQHSPLWVGFHTGVAVGAGEDAFAERRTRYRKIFLLGPSIEDPAERKKTDKET
jgi:hypothetical protein